MKKAIVKLFNVDKKVFIFLTVISIIGIITGSIFMTILSQNDKELIFSSLNTFLSEINPLKLKNNLFNNMSINILYGFVIWILGISIIGVPIVIFIIFYKSFLISFTISSFILNYNKKGILLALIYNLPHQVINLITYIYLGVYSIKISSYLIESIIYKKSINFKSIINKYLIILLVTIIIVILTSLYETYIMPILLKKILNML